MPTYTPKVPDNILFTLPPEIFVEALSYLTEREVRSNFARVCRWSRYFVEQQFSETISRKAHDFNQWQIEQLAHLRREVIDFNARYNVRLFNQPQLLGLKKAGYYFSLVGYGFPIFYCVFGLVLKYATYQSQADFLSNTIFQNYYINGEYAEELAVLAEKGTSVNYESKYFIKSPNLELIAQAKKSYLIFDIVNYVLIFSALAFLIFNFYIRYNEIFGKNQRFLSSRVTKRQADEIINFIQSNSILAIQCVDKDKIASGVSTIMQIQNYLNEAMIKLESQAKKFNDFLTKTHFMSTKNVLTQEDIKQLKNPQLERYATNIASLWSQKHPQKPLIKENAPKQNIRYA